MSTTSGPPAVVLAAHLFSVEEAEIEVRRADGGDRLILGAKDEIVVRCSLRTPATCGLSTNSWRR